MSRNRRTQQDVGAFVSPPTQEEPQGELQELQELQEELQEGSGIPVASIMRTITYNDSEIRLMKIIHELMFRTLQYSNGNWRQSRTVGSTQI
ncbi:hypothetical protein BGZ76_003908 [Entomortierella beljakovae]|nr:hypothetical protein BGZ76_003908 [Entomortierella beljakovae]